GTQELHHQGTARCPMVFELDCPECAQAFAIPADSPAGEVLAQLADEGPWTALGDGQTLEDRVSIALQGTGLVHCPQCRRPVTAGEENLAQIAHGLLMQW